MSLEEDIPSITAATGNDIGPYGDQDDEQVKKFHKDKQCCGSVMFIQDPGSDDFPSGSRILIVSIPDPHQRSKYFNPKNWFLSSRKYDPCCLSRIRILTFYPSRIPVPGVKKAPDPGSRIRIRNTEDNLGVRYKHLESLFVYRKGNLFRFLY